MKEINLISTIFKASNPENIDPTGVVINDNITKDHEFWSNANVGRFSNNKDLMDKILESLNMYKRHFQIEDVVWQNDGESSGHGGFPSSTQDDQKGFFYDSLEVSLNNMVTSVESVIALMQSFSKYILKVEIESQKKRLIIDNDQNLSSEKKEYNLELVNSEAKNYLFAFPAPTHDENQCVGGHESRLRNAHFAISNSDIDVTTLEVVLNKITSQIAQAKIEEGNSRGEDLIDNSIKIHINPALRKLIGVDEKAISDKSYQYVIDRMSLCDAMKYLIDIDKMFDQELLINAIRTYRDELAQFQYFKDHKTSVGNHPALMKHWDSIESKYGFGFNANDFIDYKLKDDQGTFPEGEIILKEEDLEEVKNSSLNHCKNSNFFQRIAHQKVYYSQFFTYEKLCQAESAIDVTQLIKGDQANDHSIAAGLFALYLLSQKFLNYTEGVERFIFMMTILEFDKNLDKIKSADLATDAYFSNLKKAILDRTKEYLVKNFKVKFSDQTSSIYDTVLSDENKKEMSNLYNKFSRYFIDSLQDSTFIDCFDKDEVFKNILFSHIDQETGESFLMMKIVKGSIALITYLIENNADINFVNTQNGYSPIITAITEVNIDALKLLIAKGVDLSRVYYDCGNESSNDLGNILHFLHKIDSVQCLDSLIDVLIEGISEDQIDTILNSKDGGGRTPLYVSISNNALNVAKKLLENEKVRVDIEDNSGRIILHELVSPQGQEIHKFDEIKSLEFLRILIDRLEKDNKLIILGSRDDCHQTAIDLLASEIGDRDNHYVFRVLFDKMSLDQIHNKDIKSHVSPVEVLITKATSNELQGLISGILLDAINVKDIEKVRFIIQSFDSSELYHYDHTDNILKEVRAVISESDKLDEDLKLEMFTTLLSFMQESSEEMFSDIDGTSVNENGTPASAFTPSNPQEGDAGQNQESPGEGDMVIADSSDDNDSSLGASPEPQSPYVARRLDFGPPDLGGPAI